MCVFKCLSSSRFVGQSFKGQQEGQQCDIMPGSAPASCPDALAQPPVPVMFFGGNALLIPAFVPCQGGRG